MSGAHASVLSYSIGLINSFGGNFIALVCRQQVGPFCPRKMRPINSFGIIVDFG